MHGIVLVVDDEEINRQILVDLLTPLGLTVHVARDGVEALARADKLPPDLLLLDVNMPRMNGFDTCRAFKGRPEHRLTPVLLLTGLLDVESRIQGLDAGADDFLGKPFDRSELIARIRSLLNLKAYTDQLEHAESVLLTLAGSIEGKDPSTEGHCQRLADLSVRLGRRLELPPDQVRALRIGGIVHDIGKVAVPDSVLLKRGPLTAEEWQLMRRHPLIGEEICRPIRSFRLVLPIIRHHHEKYDGSGYPDRLSGENIPLTARALQLVDVFDALTSERPYKPALRPVEALEIMESEVERGWWDPTLFREFRGLMREEVLPASMRLA